MSPVPAPESENANPESENANPSPVPADPRIAFADSLARELGAKRAGGLDMSGKHNPLPSEQRWAERFLEDFESARAVINPQRGILAALSHAVGQYIECDERPRTPELWSRMCECQQRAAVYLNTGEVGE